MIIESSGFGEPPPSVKGPGLPPQRPDGPESLGVALGWWLAKI